MMASHIWFGILILLSSVKSIKPSSIEVIGHRGASGYLPEHTLPCKALAYGQGVNYLEQDVALSMDNVPIVIHDIYLDEISDVASVFPGRNRSDGRFYLIDFTLAEIKQLRASERFNHQTGNPIYPNRFPLHQSTFHLVTLAEELEFIAGLNKANLDNKRQVGAYVEIKNPSFHAMENRRNMSEIVLEVLQKYNYSKRSDNIYLQCFDIDELKRIRSELRSDLKLVALLTDNRERDEYSKTDFTYWTSRIGMANLSTFVDAIGPHYAQLYERGNTLQPSELYYEARKHNLLIHPYTFRSDVVPSLFATFDVMLQFFLEILRIDGLFTDQPDRVIRYIESTQKLNKAVKFHSFSFGIVILSIALITL
ncbi:unnamed protein product [Adineta ricciae]|uniref:glycerophosphodiester phosphodiesterase n=1 Tax=Adineta ricciae TaxID=249248 RepID=A0A814DST8_ADIRI|nr:unnamed protein product [Adineta ricciae]